ncbi:tRNA pseudouridine(55) synthase TruB [Conexibacter sp. JD483]|uniref:tRNA pseudouridine(55) synthase TruB n=1 Tax=unclassified Conexibacter TaxID=2627773 RepID=UPI002724DEBB|nr:MULTISPECIES: tRNA pseudouridine(55) synthase TruB [unclassified Conexibacter]MDO8188105.1 tRNA pseudouridine(55) synthase TruB [Conexibacter sp. CPCC 205706]MDO8196899.1 tRNA pseudouridine(55) synthase TruB [Conexibacter sp. CPCC 205762]MDR9370028.1 tRNA pseudouridine(55) synthase TruB [Conexibacter sp. JD483]
MSERPLTPLDGVIVYDKPAGITSHDVVYRVRRALPRKTRVGHAGTLDPFATGLLLVLVGRGTRAQRFLMGQPKRYETIARFGATSTTGDSDGEISETGVVPAGDLLLPTGLVRQRPPAYSALRVDGERAYARARRGEEVELPEREVHVEEFRELWRDGDRRAFAIRCSTGTYVRSLVADLGDAYCQELRRTAIGPFDVADADPERIVPLAEALAFMPELRLAADAARRAAHGVAVADPEPARPDGQFTRLTDADGLIAIAEPRPGPDGARLLKPVVGLRG